MGPEGLTQTQALGKGCGVGRTGSYHQHAGPSWALASCHSPRTRDDVAPAPLTQGRPQHPDPMAPAS